MRARTYTLVNEDALAVIARGIIEADPFNVGKIVMTQNNMTIGIDLVRKHKFSGSIESDITLVVTIGDEDPDDTDYCDPEPTEARRWWNPLTWAHA